MREIYVDSRRGATDHTYTLYLNVPLRQVTSAEVTALTVSPSNVAAQQRGDVIFLDIEELRRPFSTDCLSNVNAPQTPVSTAFGLIHLKDYSVNDDVPGMKPKFYSDKKDHIRVEYPRPIPQIDRFTVRWLNYKGERVDMEDFNVFVLRFNCED